ncbi:VCBS repeat-containing protein [Robiginitalea sp. IMCC43444]|uniref:VCBS repeat-containing protein n=1 Tax=Robiginitalea sp. IMCC43444 TaxID=3459121 RepID=UPI0040419AFB
MKKTLYILLSVSVFWACKENASQFQEVNPDATGVAFSNDLKETDALNILDYLYFYNGGGVAVGDINQDGLPDLYFSGNQVKNKLYLNKGNLQFEDITEAAGVAGNSSWNTGAVMGDVNGDGLLDIYVCAVVGINGFSGHNELFINNGDNTFSERAAQYGLDFDTFSSNAAFLDYDQDGDLDLYLLNHAVHTQDSYGRAALRYDRNYDTGDKLLRNDGDRFTDVSEEAGIYGGINGYGLGLAVSDFNLDGYPDLYIGNDFHEDDYFYLNNGDGTFTESLRTYFGHSSRFSMGSDVADINNDGRPDLISLDMLPEEEVPLKSSEGDDNVQTQRIRIQNFGYYYQFTRNMLYINQPDGKFMETALMSGVAATDWSWSALFGDWNQDGRQDLFISNGIPKRPNDLDFVKFISNEQIRAKINNTKLMDQQALEMMPSGNVHNYVFEGGSDLKFTDRSGEWIKKDTILSGATAWADLDRDGDLDLVVNNLNRKASILENKNPQNHQSLKLSLHYSDKNPYGIGSKVYAWADGEMQFRELYTVRGFQASSEPMVHFGFGNLKTVDSLRIIWPGGESQILKNIETGQSLAVRAEGPALAKRPLAASEPTLLFNKLNDSAILPFEHMEDNYTDFNREKLLPYSLADRGPAFASGDLNNDGQPDLFFGGSKSNPAQIFLQRNGKYTWASLPAIQNDSIDENIAAVIEDLNGDGKMDILIGNGGGDFYGETPPLQNRYYVQTDTGFIKKAFPKYFANTSVIRPFDFDGDGDFDLFVGNQTITGKFGKRPDSFLFENEAGVFKVSAKFDGLNLGMVTDALWTDFDGDGDSDLIVVGEWMSPRFFENDGNGFKPYVSPQLNGLWQRVAPFDMDGDGDMDYALGNWGLNSKFTATESYPLQMYFSDFDGNGSTETLIATAKNGKYFPLAGLDELASQMVMLRKKYPKYSAFAGQDLTEIFGEETLEAAEKFEISELRSGFLRNEAGRFSFVPFANPLQAAPIMEFINADFDGDGKQEILAAGNYFGLKPYQGRLDSFPGALIKNENTIILANQLGLDLIHKSVRHMAIFQLKNKPCLLVVFNNAPAEVYELMN